MCMEINKKQIISKDRVTKHGEVFTAEREVNHMLDMVKDEAERIDSRFLEPACGTGNFLVEVLRRKLNVVASRYPLNPLQYECNALIALASIYGVDILSDNISDCRQRILDVFIKVHEHTYKQKCSVQLLESAQYILQKNIVHGDASTLLTVSEVVQPIVFSEWSLVGDDRIKRRDYAFSKLLNEAGTETLPLFSDLGEKAMIPEPVRDDFSLVHFLHLTSLDE